VIKHCQLSSTKANRAVIRFWITALFALSGKNYILLYIFKTKVGYVTDLFVTPQREFQVQIMKQYCEKYVWQYRIYSLYISEHLQHRW